MGLPFTYREPLVDAERKIGNNYNIWTCQDMSRQTDKQSPFYQIELRKCNGNLNQKWKWSANEGFKHLLSGKCIINPSMSNEYSKDFAGKYNTNLIAHYCGGGQEQI